MIEYDNIREFIDGYFKEFGIYKIKNSKLKYADGFYSDENLKKYAFYFQIFNKKATMLDTWQNIQDEDIALYLQNELFPYNDIRWDIYYILICVDDKPILENEFLLIEKNKFCCKKIVVDGRTIETIKESFQSKLPFTKDYYPMDNAVLVDGERFLDELRKIASLDVNIFTNEILNNIEKNHDVIGDLLKDIEVKL